MNIRKQPNQSLRHNSRARSTDGFFGGSLPSRNRIDLDQLASQSRSRKVGDFTGSDGFTPRRRNEAPANAQQSSGVHGHTKLESKDEEIGMILEVPESTQAKKKGLGRLFKGRRPKMRTVAIMFVLVFGSYFLAMGFLKARDVFRGGGGSLALQENTDPNLLNGEGDGRVNILLLGRDDAADLTDTIIVASIDPIHNEAALVSVPRDLYVQVDGLGSMKATEVFPNAKRQAIAANATERQAEFRALRTVEDTVSEVLGIPMHYYATIDFDGFKRAIDTVGGVTIDVEEPVYDVLHIDGRRYVLDVRTGSQEFDGLKALSYVRSRKTSPRGDFDRSARQRELLIALKDEVLSAGTFSNPARMNALFNDFADNVETNFSFEEVRRLYEIGNKIPTHKIASVELVGDEPNDFIRSGNLSGISIQVPRAGMYDYSEIHSYIRNKLRDGYLRKEDARVLVLNGSGQPGLATLTTEQLASYGYTMSEPDNAPSNNYRKTLIIDRTGGEKVYTKRYLEQRFKTFASTNLPSEIQIDPMTSVDFVIIIGQNEISRLQN